MDDRSTRTPHPAGDGPRDPDRSTGPDQAGKAAGPTAGRAVNQEDAALGLGGTPGGEPALELDPPEDAPLRAEGGTGLELGDQSLGSSGNAARRVDAFNTPAPGDPKH
ncbi:MAG: hypothetical protein ACXWZS_15735 [Gemmatirosa sp.]